MRLLDRQTRRNREGSFSFELTLRSSFSSPFLSFASRSVSFFLLRFFLPPFLFFFFFLIISFLFLFNNSYFCNFPVYRDVSPQRRRQFLCSFFSSPFLSSASLYLSICFSHSSLFSYPFTFFHFSFSFSFFPVISFLFPLIILIFAICLSTEASRRNGESSFSALPTFCLLYLSFPPRFLFFPLPFFLSFFLHLSFSRSLCPVHNFTSSQSAYLWRFVRVCIDWKSKPVSAPLHTMQR